MSTYTTTDIRNVLIAGHGASGKTALVEAMLLAAGTLKTAASTAEGSSFSDFEKEEKEHHHSIYSSLLHLDVDGAHINVIDTPGLPDLLGPAIACMPAVETVVVVINAQNGIEVVTRRLMEIAAERNLPRAIIINKIDLPELDLAKLLTEIQEAFGHGCLPINVPTNGGKGVIECLLNKDGQSDLGPVAQFHTAILDQIVELDEGLMESYLGGDEPNYQALHAPFEKAIDSAHVVPILFTSARENVGIREFIDSIARHFPSPLEGNPRPFLSGSNGTEKSFAYANDSGRPLLAHVFKVTTDPFVGKLAVFRVHQGRAAGNMQVFVGHNKKPVKLGHVFQLQGRQHQEAAAIVAGDIGAVAKLEDLHAGDVLHDDHALDSVHLRPLKFPTPLYGLAVTPKTRGDDQKLSSALTKIAEEDPTFKWGHDRQTHEVVITGLGELHLRLILERLSNRGLHVDTKPPKIAYRETILAPAEGHHRHKKQSGGAGQFGEVFLRIEPLERGKGFEFADEIFGGAIPGQFVPAIEKGVREVVEQGVLAGYPVQDIRVVVYDGKHHPVDSKEIAFKAAGRLAFKDAFAKAHPVLLEPIVDIEVIVPEANVGAITGDLSGKRGHIHGTDVLPGNMAVVTAQVPLSEVSQYHSQLKSVTAGRGSFNMELSHYEPVPPAVQQQVVSEYRPHAEEEWSLAPAWRREDSLGEAETPNGRRHLTLALLDALVSTSPSLSSAE